MSQLDRRQALKLLAALSGGGLVAACGANDDAETAPTADATPVRIGLVAPEAGGYRDIGDEIRAGFKLYLDLNNNRLGGHPVELLTADEGDTPEAGKAAIEGLIKQDVLALTGVVSSSTMVAVRDTVERAKVPLLGSNGSPKDLQSVVYIWRTSFVNDEPGEALGPFVASRVSRQGRVVTISPQNLAGTDAVEGFRKSFGASDPRLVSQPIWTTDSTNPSSDAFSANLDTLMSHDPEALFCFFAGTAAVRFIKQLRASGYRGDVYGSGFVTEGNVLGELKPQEATGITTALNYSPDLNNAANRTFASGYRKAHETPPTTYAMASYDAAQVLDKAIRLTEGPLTPQALNLALGRVGRIDSPRGFWQFNQTRTPQQTWYLRRVQSDGQTLSNVLVDELGTLG
ncbi:ABC transporter substrate-binding protein [Plantactinospora sp. KBS50]|uniref:ABC transporter substrate-binding protein n=1 Tax=Plantactinospora sp. KBS50 TaxID=2024580 RepID=UPI000BAB2443|nr:ABC transporter substrate-binding protein [Plantactinospora sp. KBS50]ASW58100.1 ABC transporter substrate-binding protein [Plantactinospora sp. KBS50]